MNAMTWWDHATRSVWSQPWGASIAGPLKGTSLRLIPASIVPWGTWLAEHPDTTIVANDLDREFYSSERAYDEFVIGVALQDAATAYRYSIAAEQRVINDVVGSFPVAVFVDPDTRDLRVYLRRVGAGSKFAPQRWSSVLTKRDGLLMRRWATYGTSVVVSPSKVRSRAQSFSRYHTFRRLTGRGKISIPIPTSTARSTRSGASKSGNNHDRNFSSAYHPVSGTSQ